MRSEAVKLPRRYLKGGSEASLPTESIKMNLNSTAVGPIFFPMQWILINKSEQFPS